MANRRFNPRSKPRAKRKKGYVLIPRRAFNDLLRKVNKLDQRRQREEAREDLSARLSKRFPPVPWNRRGRGR